MSRYCYCGSAYLNDGTCRYKCDPAAKPSVLRSKRAREREARQKALVENRDVGTTKYMTTMSAAIAKFDPVVRYNRARTLRAVRKSHGPGAKR